MPKILRLGGLLLVALLGLAAARALQLRRHQQAWRRQEAAHDDLLLPSQSFRQLVRADTLSPAQCDTLFQYHNLAALLRTDQAANQGFFGRRQQRLEVYVAEANQHLQQPGTYQLQGFTRVAGSIRRLAGTVQLRRVRYLTAPGDPRYTVVGTFAFRQSALAGGPVLASWHGLVAVDVEVAARRVRLFRSEGAMEYNSRGLAFEGTATTASTPTAQPVLWAEDFLPLAKHVLRDFTLGGRSSEISPKYRRAGWVDYYRNDEWWAGLPNPGH